jgi:hypothetical protein
VRIQIHRGLRINVVALLMAALIGSLINTEALANESDVQTRISAEWIDSETGNIYYNWMFFDGKGFNNKVIYLSPDGKWSRLADRFSSILKRTEWSKPHLWEMGQPGFSDDFYAFGVWIPLTLDTKNNRIVRAHTYDLSPNGKWGLSVTLNPTGQLALDGKSIYNGQVYSYFLKDIKTGTIHEWMTVQKFSGIQWLPDNTLMVNRFNPKEEQNEIFKYDPATNITKRLVLGTLYGFSKKSQLLHFVYNEPKRMPWVYDLQTGHIRSYKATQDDQAFVWTDDRPKAEAPVDLNIAELPVTEVSVVNLDEHEVVTAEGSAFVPFSFIAEGETYIPLQPLLNKFQIQVGLREGNSFDYQFTATRDGKSVSFDRHNSRVFQFRLFITPTGLQKLGLSDITVRSAEHYH